MIRDVWQTVQRMKLYILRVEILTFGLGFSLLVFAFVPVLMCLLYLSVVHIIAHILLRNEITRSRKTTGVS